MGGPIAYNNYPLAGGVWICAGDGDGDDDRCNRWCDGDDDGDNDDDGAAEHGKERILEKARAISKAKRELEFMRIRRQSMLNKNPEVHQNHYHHHRNQHDNSRNIINITITITINFTIITSDQ